MPPGANPPQAVEPEPLPSNTEEAVKPLPQEISIQKPGGAKVSGLSLSSIRAKKEYLAQKNGAKTDQDDLPREPFDEADLQLHWKEYADLVEQKGRKILASNLAADVPKLIGDHTLWIELPNSTMKKEVERDQQELLEYLREKLRNHDIQLKVTVNEEAARQYAFTPQEKYEKLREKNPAIDLLRKTFDLEL